MKSLNQLLCCISCLLGMQLISACSLVAPAPTAALEPTPLSTSTPNPSLTPTHTATPTLTPFSLSPTAIATEASDTTEEGESFETAVVIEASNEFAGIVAENEWLEIHYPGYQKIGQAVVGNNGNLYDIITILTVEGFEKDIYFDINSFFGKP